MPSTLTSLDLHLRGLGPGHYLISFCYFILFVGFLFVSGFFKKYIKYMKSTLKRVLHECMFTWGNYI